MNAQTAASREERIKSGKAPAEPKMPSAPLPLEPEVDKSMLLDRIGRYRERFPNLKSRNGKLSAKSSVDELEDELHYFEGQLGGMGGGNAGMTVLIFAMAGLEKVTETYNPRAAAQGAAGRCVAARVLWRRSVWGARGDDACAGPLSPPLSPSGRHP